jgi:hypothetical protein
MTPIEWLLSHDTGTSSKVICQVMTGSGFARHPLEASTPRDPDDFGRCYRMLRHFPSWRARLEEVAHHYPHWRPMVEAWDELSAMYERISDEDGRYRYDCDRALAGEMYERMVALNNQGGSE